jgi:hypothetical protein
MQWREGQRQSLVIRVQRPTLMVLRATWLPVVANDRMPPAEAEAMFTMVVVALIEASVLVIEGTERCLIQKPPQMVADMSSERGTQMAIVRSGTGAGDR